MQNGKASTRIGWPRMLMAAVLLIGCCWFIFGNSLQTGIESSLRSQAAAEFLARTLGRVFGERHTIVRFIYANIRKVAHAVEFFVLGAVLVLLLVVLRRVRLSMIVHAMSLVLAVAVADETIQLYVDGRGAQVQDILLDCAGGFAGLLCALGVYALCRMLFGGEW